LEKARESRDIVRSISIDGMSVRETANRLQMTEGAVRVALHRALKALAILYRSDLIGALAQDAAVRWRFGFIKPKAAMARPSRFSSEPWKQKSACSARSRNP
jgi:hypothetical protein